MQRGLVDSTYDVTTILNEVELTKLSSNTATLQCWLLLPPNSIKNRI